MYVVVRARVLQLGAELAMLQDFMDNHLFQENTLLPYRICSISSDKLPVPVAMDVSLYALKLHF
jgi:hypothetical protein